MVACSAQQTGWGRGVLQMAVGIILLGLSGCDYWPPALQTQIEQLKADLQTITAERARLEQQVVTLGRAREELQSQVDQLTRSNRERAATIAELEHALKASRAPKPVAASKPTAKPVTKSPAKTSVKAGVKTSRPNAAKKSHTVKKKPAEAGTYYKTIR